ncbi:hypothetical protein ACHAXS_006706 [Conticribra weissflogii]
METKGQGPRTTTDQHSPISTHRLKMDYQKSFIRSLSAIHTGEGKLHPFPLDPAPDQADSRRFSRRMSCNIPPLPFGSNETASREKKTLLPPHCPRRRSDDALCSRVRQSTQSAEEDATKGSKLSRSMQTRRATGICTQSDKIDMTNSEIMQGTMPQDTKKIRHNGFRKNYSLGMASRKLSDMVVEDDEVAAFELVSSLRTLDFAFVKRSNGQWTYSILAYRSVKTIKNVHDENMTFVLDNTKKTKTISKHKWASCIRLPAAGDTLLEK